MRFTFESVKVATPTLSNITSRDQTTRKRRNSRRKSDEFKNNSEDSKRPKTEEEPEEEEEEQRADSRERKMAPSWPDHRLPRKRRKKVSVSVYDERADVC